MNPQKTRILIIAAAVAAVVAGALFWMNRGQPVQQAQQYYIHDEESFQANAKSYHDIPMNNPKFEFDIQLPKDWTAERLAKTDALPSNQTIPEDLVRYKSPMIGTAQAMITIQAMNLEHQITAENWLKNYVLTNNYALQDKVAAFGGKRATAAYISVFELKSSYTYTVAQINGGVLMLARFEMPLWLKDSMGFLQKKSADSFRMLLTTDDPVEALVPFALGDALGFTYPASWTMRYSDLKDPGNMSAQIYTEDSSKKVSGLVNVLAVRRGPSTSLEAETKKLKDYLASSAGIEVKKLLSSGKAPVIGRFLFSLLEAYDTAPLGSETPDRELRLAALGDRDWYVFVFMLTPREGDNFYTWARNTATFDMIMKGLR